MWRKLATTRCIFYQKNAFFLALTHTSTKIMILPQEEIDARVTTVMKKLLKNQNISGFGFPALKKTVKKCFMIHEEY